MRVMKQNWKNLLGFFLVSVIVCVIKVWFKRVDLCFVIVQILRCT